MDIVRTRVSAIIIEDKKILLVRGKEGFYKDFYFTPGGGIEVGESDREALTRELKEELQIVPGEIEKNMEYVAKAWDGGLQKVNCYLVKSYEGELNISGEIGEIYWYSRADFEQNIVPISPSMAEFLMPKLVEMDLI
ncbi:MAG: NUDIX domain-containing protein [Candidatus Shapirobacteria bacterium]|jgi:8-oxo-dGTP pyrophosphatase MutT (NUDIX family)